MRHCLSVCRRRTSACSKRDRQARIWKQTVRDAQARLANLRREQQETAAQSRRLREALSGERARSSSIEQILNDRSYTADAVQKLFACGWGGHARGFRAVGLLADYAEVQEPQYESAVEQFLREELEYVVVESFDHARAGIAMLREEVGGRATFFVDSLRSLNLTAQSRAVPFAAEPGLVSRLDQLVEFRDPLGHAAKHFLPRLQSAFLVETAETAERLARENPADYFLTPDGTCYQGRAVTGGRPAEAGPLAMKHELRVLEWRLCALSAKRTNRRQRWRGSEADAAGSGTRTRTNHSRTSRGRESCRRRHVGAGSVARPIGASWHGVRHLPERNRTAAPEAQTARQRASGGHRKCRTPAYVLEKPPSAR